MQYFSVPLPFLFVDVSSIPPLPGSAVYIPPRFFLRTEFFLPLPLRVWEEEVVARRASRRPALLSRSRRDRDARRCACSHHDIIRHVSVYSFSHVM